MEIIGGFFIFISAILVFIILMTVLNALLMVLYYKILAFFLKKDVVEILKSRSIK